MRRVLTYAAAIVVLASVALARQAPSAGPYKVVKTARVGGTGNFDYPPLPAPKISAVLPRPSSRNDRVMSEAGKSGKRRSSSFKSARKNLNDILERKACPLPHDRRSGDPLITGSVQYLRDSPGLLPLQRARGEGEGSTRRPRLLRPDPPCTEIVP